MPPMIVIVDIFGIAEHIILNQLKFESIWRFPEMGVPPNQSKSSILVGFSMMNHPLWGIPIYGNPHLMQHAALHELEHLASGKRRLADWQEQRKRGRIRSSGFGCTWDHRGQDLVRFRVGLLCHVKCVWRWFWMFFLVIGRACVRLEYDESKNFNPQFYRKSIEIGYRSQPQFMASDSQFCVSKYQKQARITLR